MTNTPRRVRLLPYRLRVPRVPVHISRATATHTVLPTYLPGFNAALFVRLGPRPLMFTRTGHRFVFTTIRRTRSIALNHTRHTRRCNAATSRRARGVIKSEVTRVNCHPWLKINVTSLTVLVLSLWHYLCVF